MVRDSVSLGQGQGLNGRSRTQRESRTPWRVKDSPGGPRTVTGSRTPWRVKDLPGRPRTVTGSRTQWKVKDSLLVKDLIVGQG